MKPTKDMVARAVDYVCVKDGAKLAFGTTWGVEQLLYAVLDGYELAPFGLSRTEEHARDIAVRGLGSGLAGTIEVGVAVLRDVLSALDRAQRTLAPKQSEPEDFSLRQTTAALDVAKGYSIHVTGLVVREMLAAAGVPAQPAPVVEQTVSGRVLADMQNENARLRSALAEAIASESAAVTRLQQVYDTQPEPVVEPLSDELRGEAELILKREAWEFAPQPVASRVAAELLRRCPVHTPKQRTPAELADDIRNTCGRANEHHQKSFAPALAELVRLAEIGAIK